MSEIRDLITLGIGPGSDIASFTTFGLGIGAEAVVVEAFTQPVPRAFQQNREQASFFETVRRRSTSATTDKFGTVKRAAAQPNSTAETVADLRADFNALLSKFRNAGSMDS